MVAVVVASEEAGAAGAVGKAEELGKLHVFCSWFLC